MRCGIEIYILMFEVHVRWRIQLCYSVQHTAGLESWKSAAERQLGISKSHFQPRTIPIDIMALLWRYSTKAFVQTVQCISRAFIYHRFAKKIAAVVGFKGRGGGLGWTSCTHPLLHRRSNATIHCDTRGSRCSKDNFSNFFTTGQRRTT